MPDIEIASEREEPNAWSYEVRVFADGQTHHFHVRLSWQDYDLWSHGRVSPSRVVDALFRFLLAREAPEQILARFDCALVRRYFGDVDRELPALI